MSRFIFYVSIAISLRGNKTRLGWFFIYIALATANIISIKPHVIKYRLFSWRLYIYDVSSVEIICGLGGDQIHS